MSAVTIHQMADRISGLLEERLGATGKDLPSKLRKCKRRLPRKVAAAAQALADAAQQANNPKLLVQIDQAAVAQNYDTCVRHLSALRAGGRATGTLINVAATVVAGLLILGAVVIGVMRMRGQI